MNWIKTKEELRDYMNPYGNHVNITFGSKYALRNRYDDNYYLVKYKYEHDDPNHRHSFITESEIEVDLDEAYSFILQERRLSKIKKIC